MSRSADPPDPTDALGPQHDHFALRREDLGALAAAYLRENRRPRQWAGLVTGIGGLAAAAVLITIGGRLGWPDSLGPWFLAGGWAVMIGSFAVVWRREKVLRARYRFDCPACHEPLLDGIRHASALSRVELVVATGNCPRCGAQILPR